jgi:hypothetical protein
LYKFSFKICNKKRESLVLQTYNKFGTQLIFLGKVANIYVLSINLYKQPTNTNIHV